MNQKGMTLIEVLLAVVVLSIGLVAVHRALLASFQTLKYAENRLEAERILSEKKWELEDYLSRMKRLPASLSNETVSLGSRKASYSLTTDSLGLDFFVVTHRLQWNFQGQVKRIALKTYELA